MNDYEIRIAEYRKRHTTEIGRCRVQPYEVRMQSNKDGFWTVSHPAARSWAVYLDGALLAVTVYLKGAVAVANALNA